MTKAKFFAMVHYWTWRIAILEHKVLTAILCEGEGGQMLSSEKSE